MQIIIPLSNSGILIPAVCPLCNTSAKDQRLVIDHNLAFCNVHMREFNAYLESQLKIYVTVIEIIIIIGAILFVSITNTLKFAVWIISLFCASYLAIEKGLVHYYSRHYLRDHSDFIPHYQKETLYITSTNIEWNAIFTELNSQLPEAQLFVKEELEKREKKENLFSLFMLILVSILFTMWSIFFVF